MSISIASNNSLHTLHESDSKSYNSESSEGLNASAPSHSPAKKTSVIDRSSEPVFSYTLRE